eukprot:scaffold68895_cov63-Phaeocystis_antarctica.AAC.2
MRRAFGGGSGWGGGGGGLGRGGAGGERGEASVELLGGEDGRREPLLRRAAQRTLLRREPAQRVALGSEPPPRLAQRRLRGSQPHLVRRHRPRELRVRALCTRRLPG